VEFLFGLIVLILNIWAIVNIVGSAASTGAKVLWILLILFLPILGFIIGGGGGGAGGAPRGGGGPPTRNGTQSACGGVPLRTSR
jgi:hypothetical protein